MKISEEFKFLNVQAVKRKTSDEFFYIIGLLDKENNPVKFYSFDDSINAQMLKSIQSEELKAFQECIVNFELAFSNDKWNVRLINIEYV